MDRQQLPVLVLSILAAVACTKAGEAIADVVAHQLNADQVLFDDTQAGLGADNVQAAVEAVAEAGTSRDTKLAALEARIASLENTITSLETRLAAGEAAQASTDGKLQGIETDTSSLDDGLTALQTELAGVAASEIQWTCPDGMVMANGACVDLAPQPSAENFGFARSACRSDGKRLCRVAELTQACINSGVIPFDPANPEWTEDLVSHSDAAILDYGGGCGGSLLFDVSPGKDITDTAHFRCCAPRQAVLVVPEPGE